MNCGDGVRSHFPTLKSSGHDRPLVYLDSAAMALKPECVIEAVTDVMIHKSANTHRAVHRLGDLATEAYEQSRDIVANFINALSHEIVFVKSTTEALNLVSRGLALRGQTDTAVNGRTIVSLAEHHSNLLPWHSDVTRLPPQADGRFDLEALAHQLRRGNVSVVSVSHISNVTGAVNDIRTLADMCHQHGALLVVDAAQSAPHMPLDVVALDCDFLAFSGHKCGGPTGAGVLYGKSEHLDRIAWHLEGGGTIESINGDSVVPKDTPWRLEAGTPAVESVVGLGAALEFLSGLGMEHVQHHIDRLRQHAVKRLREQLPHLEILGNDQCTGPVSLVQRKVSPHVLARGLSDRFNICVRSGFHCAQPLHQHLGVPASLRLSFFVYNTEAEIDFAVDCLNSLLPCDL